MSWLPDPTKFLRRSYRKGDGDHQEKPARSKGVLKPGGTSSKHSSLYSLMQASSTPSLERSTEDENPSSYGATESTTCNTEGHLNAITDSADVLSSHSHADLNDLALIRHAANILISNVPSSQAHVTQHAIKDGAHDASPHAIKDPHASHLPPSASHDLHVSREPLAAEDEGTKEVKDPLSLNGNGRSGVIFEEGLSFAALINSENEDNIDESKCKIISEDLAALRASPDGKINSPSTSRDAKGKRKGKGNREQQSKRKSPVGAGRKDPNKSSVLEKNRQPNSRKNSQRGEGKKSSSTKNLHLDQRENPKMEKDREAGSKHSQFMEYRRRELSSSLNVSDQALILLEEHAESMADDMLERDLRLYNHRKPSYDSRKSPITTSTLRKEPNSPLMPHQAFSLQASEGTGDRARISIGRDVPELNSRSPTLMVGRRSESNTPLITQRQDFSFQGIEVMEEKAWNSIGHEAPERNTRRRSPLMVGRKESNSPSTYQILSLQDSEIMGDRGRISIGHDTIELSRRSPLMVSRREPKSPVTPHQVFSLQDHGVMGERARRSVGYDPIELGSRAQSPFLVAGRDHLNFSSTPSHQISSLQESEIIGETARVSIGYEASELGSRRRSPLVLARREPNSPSTLHQNFSLRDNEMMGERARISVGCNGQELGLRRQSPNMGGRNGPNSPLMQHHNFLLPDTEERARRSLGRDIDLGLDSSRRSPFTVASCQESKPPVVSSERFYFQEDELRSLYDRSPSPFSPSQASLLQGSVYIDHIPSLPLPATSQQVFLQNDGSQSTAPYYEPTSPLVTSKRYVLQEDQRAYISPYLSSHKKFSQCRNERVYAESGTSPMLTHPDLYSQDDSERGYDDNEGSANKRSSFYYEGPQGGSISRDNYCSPLMSQRRETLDMSMLSNGAFLMQESEEALCDEQLADHELAESNELIENNVFSDSAKRDTLIGNDEAIAMVQHYMRQQRSKEMQHLREEENQSEMQLLQEEEDQLFQLYTEVLSENSIKSSHSRKQRSKAEAMSMGPLSENSSSKSFSMTHRSKEAEIDKPEAMSMQSPLSEANSSISSGKRMMKRLEAAQAEIAVVRHARRGFEEMVVEMVGSGGEQGEEEYAVQNLLDLEEFVGSYESLSSSSGIFKGMVDQFFHELCCELLQPVSYEDDPVLSIALLRLEQMDCSPL